MKNCHDINGKIVLCGLQCSKRRQLALSILSDTVSFCCFVCFLCKLVLEVIFIFKDILCEHFSIKMVDLLRIFKKVINNWKKIQNIIICQRLCQQLKKIHIRILLTQLSYKDMLAGEKTRIQLSCSTMDSVTQNAFIYIHGDTQVWSLQHLITEMWSNVQF